MCIETGEYWKLDLPEEVQRRTIRGGLVAADLISINLLEVTAMVMIAFGMEDMRGERPLRKAEAVLISADNEAAVARGKRCRGGGQRQARAGPLMTIIGVLEAKGGWCFQARHVRGVYIMLADGMTRRNKTPIL